MIEPNSEAYKLLYCDDDGDLIMLDEVQLMDEVPAERIEPLRAMLNGDDVYASYQATLVLAAWADPVGLDAAASHIQNNVHEQQLSPHRLLGVDTAYDEIAQALAYGLNNADSAAVSIIEQAAKTLLARYEHHYFRSGMRRLLNKLADADLLAEMTSAVQRTITTGNHYQAAELLVPISRIDPVQAWKLIDLFRTETGIEREAQPNVCDALAQIHTPESKALLESLLSSDRAGVKDAAEKALAAHNPR